MAARFVIVDDSDPGIRYTGPWFESHGQTDDLGNFGTPFLRTSHGVTEDASLSYTFTGSRVAVFGTSLVTTVDGSTDPSWECLVDNVSIGSKAPILFPENNWVFCEANSLSDGRHTITLRATVRDKNTFWFDRIQYLPSAGVSLDSSLVLVDSSDSAIQYGSGWQNMRDIGRMTLEHGAKVTVDFGGTSLKWFSLIPGNGMPGASTSATYSIDGGRPVTFLLAGLAAGTMEPYNQLFFEVSGLSAAQHRLEVVHDGNSQTTPLSLNYLVIQYAAVPAGSTPQITSISGLSSSSLSASSSSPSIGSSNSTTAYNSLSFTGLPVATGSSGSSVPSSSSQPGGSSSPSVTGEHKGAPIGAIAGGAVGGVVLIVAVILLSLLLRRRRNRNRNSVDSQLNQEPSSPNIVEPFNAPPTAPVSFQKFSPYGQSSSTGPSPEGKDGHIPQYPSQSTIPTGPRPSRSRSSNQSSSQTSGSHANQNSTPGNSTSRLLGSEKAREAGELGDLPSTNISSAESETPVASTSHSTSDTDRQRVMRHEDSGIRLPARQTMLELPPLYTVS